MLTVGCESGYEPVHFLPKGFENFESYVSLGSKPIDIGFLGNPVDGKRFLIYRYLDPNPENNCLLLTDTVIPVFAKRACLMEQTKGIYMINCTQKEYNEQVRNKTWRISSPKK
jgi:hypothetical protein